MEELTSLATLIKSGALVVFFILSEIILFIARKRLSYWYDGAKKTVKEMKEIEELSLVYLRKRQLFGIVRAAVIALTLLTGVLLYDIQAFSFLALALGALVIIQKENISSLVAYPFVISNYNVGDDIRIKDSLGELIRISPLHVLLAGKEENGEYNGKRTSIPNFLFLNEQVSVQELKSDTYRRIIIRPVYNKAEYGTDFDTFLEKIRIFLDEFLPRRDLNQVGTFRSFAGAQYKLNFDYDEKGNIALRIAFISRPHDVVDRKERIIEFIESLRVAPLTTNEKASA